VIILEACVAVVFVEAILLRIRLSKLLTVRFRRMYLVWIALLDQILVISFLPGSWHAVLDVANLMSYLAAGVFIWSNRRTPGVLLVGLGGALNLLAMGLNGGTMPASASALSASGWKPAPGHFTNSAVVAHPKLAFLGDIFATPKWIPAHDVFSVGDVLIVLAVGVLVYRVCKSAPREVAETSLSDLVISLRLVRANQRLPSGPAAMSTGARSSANCRRQSVFP
jgi:hypothetical protein